ncbi:MAG: 50S ribosomal protein L29 [Candidatus Cloacimonetes bacterium]|nr:50S ribosomal protein L29 [Candidatus Cloacimonadota bacterium]
MKTSELRELSLDELQQKLNDSQQEMFNLNFQKALNRLENKMRLKVVKKDIARILTLITERQTNEIEK